LLEEVFGECSPTREYLLWFSGIFTLLSSDASEDPDDEGDLSENAGLLTLGERRLLFFKSVGSSKEFAWFRKKVDTRGMACGILRDFYGGRRSDAARASA
jgi:hypothetical protein